MHSSTPMMHMCKLGSSACKSMGVCLVHRHLAWHRHPLHTAHYTRLVSSTPAIASTHTPPTATPPTSDNATESLLEPAMTWPRRSHGCGTVTADDSGTRLTICGWVDRYRNLGGIVFLDIRDHTGVVQVRTIEQKHTHSYA